MTTRDMREAIQQEAHNMLDVPYKHQGRTDQSVDCIGLVLCIGSKLGLLDYEPYLYSKRPDGQKLLAEARRVLVQRPSLELVGGSIAVLRTNQFPCHFGIITECSRGLPSLVHALASRRKVTKDLLSPTSRFTENIVAIFDFPGMN